MNSKLCYLFIPLSLFAGIDHAAAQGTKFFRIYGPAPTAITAFGPDGNLVWSNAQPGATYTVQTLSSLPGGTNWVDYVQLPTTNPVQTNQLVAFDPPAGMAFIPGGSFTMGNSSGDADITDANPTNIYVSGFYLDTNLVSYSQWAAVYDWATNNGYCFDYAGQGKGTNHPVQFVDWYDAVKWSNARSQMEGLPPVYYTDSDLTQIYTNGDLDEVFPNWLANGYRLPTEAEWEKAARGGLDGKRFPYGDTISESQANYDGDTYDYSYDLGPTGYNSNFYYGSFPYTSPVGFFAPNGYGLCDMAGDVFEMCWDWYGTPYGQPAPLNPTGPASGSNRVQRGGFATYFAYELRCADRNSETPTGAGVFIGFRCAKGL